MGLSQTKDFNKATKSSFFRSQLITLYPSLGARGEGDDRG